MAIDSDLVKISLFLCFVHMLNQPQKSSSDITRRPYLRPTLTINTAPVPKHWDLSSRNVNIDIDEEDGYVLSANGEASASGIFVPCDTLSGIGNARRGRRVRPQMLYRRRVSTQPTSPTLSVTCPTVSPLPRNTANSPLNISSSKAFLWPPLL